MVMLVLIYFHQLNKVLEEFAWRYNAVVADLKAARDAKHSPHPSDALLDGNLVAL